MAVQTCPRCRVVVVPRGPCVFCGMHPELAGPPEPARETIGLRAFWS